MFGGKLAALRYPELELVVATAHRPVDLSDEAATADAVAWWEALTGAGSEGVVVKPRESMRRGKRGLLQPAIKCRGHEYLRIIYGLRLRPAGEPRAALEARAGVQAPARAA